MLDLQYLKAKNPNITISDIKLGFILSKEDEEWRYIDGYNEKYAVSNHGRVFAFGNTHIGPNGRKTKTKSKFLKQTNSNGYYTVRLTNDGIGENKLVHRLVADAFIIKKEGHNIVNHIDGDKLNNNYTNLEWCTYGHNLQHSHDNDMHGQNKKVLVLEDGVITNSFVSLHDAGRRLNIPFQKIAKIIDTGDIYNNRYEFISLKENFEKVIFFSRLRDDAVVPSKIDENGGYDVYCVFDEDEIIIPPNTIHKFNTGICSAFSSKYVLIGYERGSTGTKGMAVRSMVIDSGYRGEWIVPINNTTNKNIVISKKVTKSTETDDTIYYPYINAICQVCLHIVPEVNVVEVGIDTILSMDSSRKFDSFGSTNHIHEYKVA